MLNIELTCVSVNGEMEQLSNVLRDLKLLEADFFSKFHILRRLAINKQTCLAVLSKYPAVIKTVKKSCFSALISLFVDMAKH